MNSCTEVIESRDEVLAKQYDKMADGLFTLAKEWADKGCCAHYYESAYRCCVRGETFRQIAYDLRQPRNSRLECEDQ